MIFNIIKKIKQKTKIPYFYQNNVEIIGKNILDNYDLYSKFSNNVFPVLKSNAYGHGIHEVAKIFQRRKVDYIVVDGYFEALQIHQVSPNQKVLVMGYVDQLNLTYINFKKISLVVQSLEILEELILLKKAINIHLEINTGMNRWGIHTDEMDLFLNLIKSQKLVKLEGVMSHLADSDNIQNGYTNKQLHVFDNCIRKIFDFGIRPKYIHLGQSAGSTKVELSKYSNTIRVGIGLYGYNPLDTKDSNFAILQGLKPALVFKTKIIKINTIKKGESVGYNCTWKAEENTNIAVLPVGYYEGIPREWNQKSQARVRIKDKYYPIVGRICMNICMIDIGNLEPLKVGDEVEVFTLDGDNTIISVAKQNNTIPYTLLTGINYFVHKKLIV
jgi:alanine racemase